MISLKTKGHTQVHKKYTRKTPNQKKKKKGKKKFMKTRNMKTIIGGYPLENGIEKEGL
jgi:hypothetical protein